MIKVVIADDEEKVCQLIYNLVDWKEKEMEVVGIAHNGIEALSCVEELKPDLMITDIRMPGYDGLELIHRAKDACPQVECIIISGYRHFEYAQNAIKYGVEDYLLKPINREEINKTLDKIRYKYQVRMQKLGEEEYLKMRLENDMQILHMKLYTDIVEGRKDFMVAGLNEEYHYRFAEGMFLIFIVKFDYGRRYEPDSGTILLTGKIRQIVREVMEASCFELDTFPGEGMVCCVVNFDSQNMRVIHRKIRTVLDELLVQRTVFGTVQFTIGKGGAYSEPKMLCESYRQALLAAKARILLGTDRVIEGVEEETHMAEIDRMSAEFMKEMDSALETLDQKAVSMAIEALKEKLLAAEGITGSGIMSAVGETGKIYVMSLKKYGIVLPGEETFLNEFEAGIEQCPQVEEVFRYVQGKIGKSLELLIEEKSRESTRPIRMAKQYMKENYKKPITLDEVSAHVGFSAAYFSSLFKKESGMNFLEYLSELRMNRAKELLKETNMSVTVICEEVGYSDIKHFTKSFKKNTGINPKDYRKLYS